MMFMRDIEPALIPKLILEAVKEHNKQLGVHSLALVLKGSRDKKILRRNLQTSRFFGALLYYPIDVIQNFIKQVRTQEYIGTVAVESSLMSFPVLSLTEKGRKALVTNETIPVALERTLRPVLLNETAKETLRWFHEQKSVEEIAQFRNLAVSTVWKHFVSCVACGLIPVSELVSDDKLTVIRETKKRLQTRRLKRLKEVLPNEISYEEIRCVIADDVHRESVIINNEKSSLKNTSLYFKVVK
jgi:uncharacterized protein YpbB